MKKKLIAIMLILTMSLSMTACGESKDSKKVKTEDDSKDESNLKAEKNLLSVEVTLPASLIGDSETALDEKAKAAGVKEVKKNDDGSITMKMTKKAHKELLDAFKTGIDESITEILEDKENYPSFDSITYNDDVTVFDINVDSSTYGGMQMFAALAFYIEGNMYQAINAVPDDQLKTIVNFKDKDTGEIIESGDSSSTDEDSAEE